MDASFFDSSLRLKPSYKFWVKEHVRFTDLDALGHVSAVRTNEYFNSARASLFHHCIAQWPHAALLPVMKLSVVLNEREMHFPLDLAVGAVIEKWGNTSLTMALGLFGGDDCLALSRNVFVFIDATTRKPAPPSEVMKSNFIRLAGS